MSNGVFQNLSSLLASKDLIRSDSYLEHTTVCEVCEYAKTDFFFQSGTWRERNIASVLRRRDLKGKNLIVGHSDLVCSKTNLALAKLKGIKKVWGINTPQRGHFSKPIPLGLTNNSGESELHALFGNDALMEIANEEPFQQKFSGLVYANFTIKNNNYERLRILREVEKNILTFHNPEFSRAGRIKYLKMLRKSNFVLCPEGNGIDTHRIWETLYMGGIPVILNNAMLTNLVEDLPVLIVKDWRELNDMRRVEFYWHELIGKHYSFDKLRSSFWINEICNEK
jgi:hypothetical protein